MSTANGSPRLLVLVKHAQPVLDPTVPPRVWTLGPEGEEQSVRLAQTLAQFAPYELVTSKEPKARRTAELVAVHAGVPLHVLDGLEELDRSAMPLMSKEEHARVNARLFEAQGQQVLGRESAHEAGARFTAAVSAAVALAPPEQNVVVIAHGTVIALFVARWTGENAYELWKSLGCGSFVTLPLPLVPAVSASASKKT